MRKTHGGFGLSGLFAGVCDSVGADLIVAAAESSKGAWIDCLVDANGRTLFLLLGQ